MKRVLVLAMCALLGACETVPTAGAGRCDANAVRQFTGSLATADLGQVILRRSGARTIRWIQPDMIVTLDYRRDRLNAKLDPRNFITGLDCG
jgi:Peptidase inhibitor I78 family